MKNPHRCFLVLCFLVFTVFDSNADEKIYVEAAKTADLIAKEGQKIVVYGETDGSGKSASGTNFVNFKDAEFFLVTFKTDLGQFKEGEPHVLYDGKRLAVEGTITLYQGKPQIKLTAPEQIVILEPDAVFPPPVSKEAKTTEPDKTKKEAATPPAGETLPEAPPRKPPVDPSEYFKN